MYRIGYYLFEPESSLAIDKGIVNVYKGNQLKIFEENIKAFRFLDRMIFLMALNRLVIMTFVFQIKERELL